MFCQADKVSLSRGTLKCYTPSKMPKLHRDARNVVHAVALPQRYNVDLLQQEEGLAGRGNSQSFDLIQSLG
jgi:hypothetical protein